MERVQAMLAFAAHDPERAGHDALSPAARLLRAEGRREPAAGRAGRGPQVVMGVNVVNTTTYDEATKTATCTIADIDLQSQILTLWNALAGIDTPS